MSKDKITVVGLGPGREGLITLETADMLKNSHYIFLRTELHPSVAFLQKHNISYESFDGLYERHNDFDNLFKEIAATLIGAAKEHHSIVYAVPGSPLMGESCVDILIKQGPANNVDIEVFEGVSFLDAVCKRAGIDPSNNISVLDGLSLEEATLDTGHFNIITHIDNQTTASNVKLKFMEACGDEHNIIVVQNAGTSGKEKVMTIPFYELDRLQWLNHMTTIIIPPANSRNTISTCEYPMDRLINIMTILRGPDGCPWDREQNHKTIKSNLIEEAYEVLEAIDKEDVDDIKEELGDLLLQVVFHSQFEDEKGNFNINDVINTICEKLERRHPHVFGCLEVAGTEEVLKNWDDIKEREKTKKDKPISVLDGIPRELPALIHAEKIQRKAAKVGFDWDKTEHAFAKVMEEIEELKEAMTKEDSQGQIENELGDLLFAIVNVARFLSIDAEQALIGTIQKFYLRFQHIEEEAKKRGKDLQNMTLDDMDKLWNEAKSL